MRLFSVISRTLMGDLTPLQMCNQCFYSPSRLGKRQHYWNLTIRLFCVLSRTLVGEGGPYPFAKKQSVYSTASPSWLGRLQHYWNLTIRLFGVISRTLVGQGFCVDTGCSPEDLPEAMNDRKGWREGVVDIRANGTRWWWWWWINNEGSFS